MTTYCGYIALVGRPNVGKSTLLNRLLGQKLSITSRKAQTTRHSILGINTQNDYQYVYVDTPGIHSKQKKAMNRIMNKTADAVIHDVDVIVFIVERNVFTEEDELVLEKIKKANIPCILVINKVDRIKDKDALLPTIENWNGRHEFEHILPLSAKTGANVETLETQLQSYLPQGPHLFGQDQITDRPTRFLIAEIVREKVFRLCGQELPYSVTVEIEQFKQEDKLTRIAALIWVEKDSHKQMIIGKKGAKLKEIGTGARLDMEKMLDKKVFLQLWVKVKSGWSDDERSLKSLGYHD
jgi:GTP-binding protein Era